MPEPSLTFTVPLVYMATMVITGLSAYYVYRQKTTAYEYTKGLLIAVHIFFEGVIVFEFMRNYFFPVELMVVYTVGGTTLILIDVVLLTLISIVVYLRPTGTGYTGIINEMLSRKRHLFLFALFVAYIIYVQLYLVFFLPFTTDIVENIVGLPVYVAEYTNLYLNYVVIILLIFLAYPSMLLVLAARKVTDRSVRRTLVLLPIVWTGIGADLIFFNGYLLSVGIDATPVGYILAAAAFGITAFTFRRASVLAGFFEPIMKQEQIQTPFSSKLPLPIDLYGKAILLEVDPTSKYEEAVRDFAIEHASKGSPVFVFTSRGTPVYNALLNADGVRFYIMTESVSYPKPARQTYEVLVPHSDQAVLLDLLDKTKESLPQGSIAFVFDSISDFILYSGFESCYKFLKQANEILGDSRTSSLFLITRGAHDERIVAQVKSLFSVHMVYDRQGIRITK